jgi:hypothetical protein
MRSPVSDLIENVLEQVGAINPEKAEHREASCMNRLIQKS